MAYTLPFASGMYMVPLYSTGSASAREPVKLGLPFVGMKTFVCQAIFSCLMFELVICVSPENCWLKLLPWAAIQSFVGVAVRSLPLNAGIGAIALRSPEATEINTSATEAIVNPPRMSPFAFIGFLLPLPVR